MNVRLSETDHTPPPLVPKNSVKTVAFIATYPPRQCGIATFTADLVEALAQRSPGKQLLVLPINDIEEGYTYSPRVRFEIVENDLESYRRAADFLNVNNVDLVCLQHEFGIFGGEAGSHILTLLRELRMPIVTTLHTVLSEPNPAQRQVMMRLAELSDRLVVMSQRGIAILQEGYGLGEEKIDLIPHGVVEMPFVDPNYYKDQFGVEGKLVLLTFGLLSPNKGIEVAIRALPAITARYPQVVYIVLGATHPHVKRHAGEMYRLSLQRLARELGVEEHVIFHNRFVSQQELLEFIAAADIYLTPYLSKTQITSGTLAYAVGAGKAVISTPYWHAEELLANECGLLVPFGDAEALAHAVIQLLDNEAERHAMRKRAYLASREMIWSEVAARYAASFERAKLLRTQAPRRVRPPKTLATRPGELPLLRLHHLRALTDSTGLLQHASFAVPNYREGYTTDDNARALLLAVLLESFESGEARLAREMATRYAAFLLYAFNPKAGRFRNFMSYERNWRESVGSEDSHGRALWSLGAVLEHSSDDALRKLAARLFNQALPAVQAMTSPRAWAFTLLGLSSYLKRFPGDSSARQCRQALAERLLEAYDQHRLDDWCWFEDVLTYDNARLPHALLVAGEGLANEEMQRAGLEALAWLCRLQRGESGHFVPIGSNGFYSRGGTRARFDQQPIEAYSTVCACLAAYQLTREVHWYLEAERAFEWFLGANDLGLPLYDPASGGCRDGLHADRLNENQGAESTLAFLLSLVEMKLAQRELSIDDKGAHKGAAA